MTPLTEINLPGKIHELVAETYWSCVTWLRLAEIMISDYNQGCSAVQVA